MTYRVLRGRWFNIIVLNAQAPAKKKSDDLQDSLYEELEQIFHHFPKYHMRILLEDFNAKLRREDIFKPTIGNDSLHQDSNDNGVRVVNLLHKKILLKTRCFRTETFVNALVHHLMGTYTVRLITY